jgi:predicted nucleic-acid-binding protein
MIGIDTNILLRAITCDDDVLSHYARNFLSNLTSSHKGVVNSVVLVEFVWTLRRGYKYERHDITAIIDKMLQSPCYQFTDRKATNAAIERCKLENIEFADALIGELNREFGCTTTMTFDENASKSDTFTKLLKNWTLSL